MNKKLKGISRIDSRSTHGWYVRIYANGGVFTSKLFSDRQYGSKEKALKNAIAWRDHNQMVADIYKKEHPMPKKRPPYYKKKPKNNSSGIVGVHTVHSSKGDKKVVYVQATWSENGQPRSKKFYITKKRSVEEALKQAKELRKQKEKELYKAWKEALKESSKKKK